MSVQFFGWDVTYDDNSPHELGASQTPKDSGVYTMFHGTSVASARLILANGISKSTKGMLGPGVYVSRDRKKAERYPLNSSASDRVVLQLRVRVGRVKRIDKDNHPMQYSWNSHGYDTAWVPPKCGMKAVPSGLEEDCVFDEKRVTVSGIALAPDNVQTELQGILATSLGSGGGGDNTEMCQLCKRKTAKGLPHDNQKCWGCGKNICPLMSKHFCRSGN